MNVDAQTEVRHAIVLAGGKGTRLREISAEWGELPKPLVPIGGVPVLEHQIRWLGRAGVRDILVLGQYQIEKLREFAAQVNIDGVRIRIEEEPEPLGTAGAVLRAHRMGLLAERFWVVYGDTMLAVDAAPMLHRHAQSRAQATLFLHPNDHPADSDLVSVDVQGWVTAFHGYPHAPGLDLPNLVNAALYVMERECLNGVLPENAGKVDFGKDFFPKALAAGKKLLGYRSADYIKDMGTTERYRKVQRHFLEGRIRSMRGEGAIFLDRDGTLNTRHGYVRTPDQLQLLPGAAQALRQINQAGLRTALITNQPVIARGECTWEGLQRIHNRLETLLGAEGAWLDQIYFCPHHPDAGFPGEVAELKIRCECRKPGSKMLRDAAMEMGVDLTRSWMVGDASVDVAAGKNVGAKTILLRTGEAGQDWKTLERPDFECVDLADAVDLILRRYPRAVRELEAWPVAAQAVFAIGGLARSGKSELASVLAGVAQSRGLQAHVIALDGWIKPWDRRGAESAALEERFDLDGAQQWILELKRRRATLTPGSRVDVEIPVYDRMARRPRSERVTKSIGLEDVLIFEGVVALEMPVLGSVHRVWVEVDESVRKERFAREYAWRGRSEEVERLYADRKHEHKRLLLQRASASWVAYSTPPRAPTEQPEGGAHHDH